eukprot:TRINITY_DN14483_c0_g1_i1.p1 TRINITY_DN14483_c0_g1~~TRINITY_DN14483_c0_g1_i1.p1  ORF type:complete len:471 (+),score=1.26 TRINITY_DN14483_c0_g1_i1:81-1493(+)
MWRKFFECGLLSKKRNTLTCEFPPNCTHYEFLTIACELRPKEPFLVKLRDKSGCDHALPYHVNKDDIATKLSTFTFIVEEYNVTKDFFKINCCVVGHHGMPVLKNYSPTTVKILPREEDTVNSYEYIGQYRKKGRKEWTKGTLVTFDSIDEIYECQVGYKMDYDNYIIYSHIVEAKCPFKSFNIKKASYLDLEQMLLHKRIEINFDEESIYNTEYTATLKLLDPVDSEYYNKEIVTKNSENYGPNYPVFPGARLEYKMTIPKYNTSYTRIITVPVIPPADEKLWSKNFGDAESVKFTYKDSRMVETYVDQSNSDDTIMLERDITLMHLTLYKNGFWEFRNTFDGGERLTIEVTRSVDEVERCTGIFRILPLPENDTRMRLEMVKYFSTQLGEQQPPKFKVSDLKIQPQDPKALQLKELVALIASYINDKPLKLRLVCRSWSQFIPASYVIRGTLTSSYADVYNFVFDRDD